MSEIIECFETTVTSVNTLTADADLDSLIQPGEFEVTEELCFRNEDYKKKNISKLEGLLTNGAFTPKLLSADSTYIFSTHLKI